MSRKNGTAVRTLTDSAKFVHQLFDWMLEPDDHAADVPIALIKDFRVWVDILAEESVGCFVDQWTADDWISQFTDLIGKKRKTVKASPHLASCYFTVLAPHACEQHIAISHYVEVMSRYLGFPDDLVFKRDGSVVRVVSRRPIKGYDIDVAFHLDASACQAENEMSPARRSSIYGSPYPRLVQVSN